MKQMNECSCRALYEKILPFWQKLSDEDAELLCTNSFETSYRKNENIHGGNGKCTGAIVIKSGCARAYMLSEEGREITLYRLFPGDICMLSASCVLKSITFDVFIDAESESECYIINGKAFADVAKRNVYAENFALDMAVKRFSDVMWIMQQILFMSFDKRLAIFLLDEAEKNDGVTVRLTHEQIAKYIGSAREVVSRMLKYFSSEGMIKSDRSEIRITDKEKLRLLTL